MQGLDDETRRVKQFESRAAWGPNSIEDEGRGVKKEIAHTTLPEFANAEHSATEWQAAMLCAAAQPS